MKTIIIFLLLTIVFHASCKKEPEPISAEPPIIAIPVHQPCDTTYGKASAVKLSTIWLGGGYCWSYIFEGEKLWSFEFTACSNEGFVREDLSFGGIRDKDLLGEHKVIGNAFHAGDRVVIGAYATLLDDGDVLEDFFIADTTATDNYFIIDKWDETNKRVEGRFGVTMKFSSGPNTSINPDIFKIRSGKFWAVIP